VPSTSHASATVIQLSAVSSRGSDPAQTTQTRQNAPPARRGSRGGDLIFGGALALILLIACLTWEVLSVGKEEPHAAVQGTQRVFIPAVH
jgi:hypothetical protein